MMNMLYIEGASTAEGHGGGTDFMRSWSSHVQNAFPNHYIVNRARAGLSLSAINKKWSAEHQGTRVPGLARILSVGQNEARINPELKKPMITLERFAGDLALFSRATRESGLLPIYIGPQPVDETKTLPVPTTGWYIENDLTEEYADLVREQAALDRTSYVDVAGIFAPHHIADLMDEDGRHPNTRGHLLIGRAVVRELTLLGIEAYEPTSM